MPQVFKLKQGDTDPPADITLKRSGVAVNLSNDAGRAATAAKLSMWDTGGTAKISDATCALLTPASGIVRYSWAAADTNTVGVYRGDVRVTWNDGKLETFPSPDDTDTDGYIIFDIAQRKP